MTLRDTTSFLRSALLADGAVSGATGLLLAASAPVASLLLGLPATFLAGTGIFLVGYGAALVLLARAPRVSTAAARVVIAGNAVWVLASLGLLLLGPASLTSLGMGFVVLQAVVVAILTELQWMGLRREAVVAATG